MREVISILTAKSVVELKLLVILVSPVFYCSFATTTLWTIKICQFYFYASLLV